MITTSSTDRECPRPTKPSQLGPLRFALIALCCALFGLGCMTISTVVEVTRTDDGQHMVGQSMSMEFNKKVCDALEPQDRKSLTDLPHGLKKAGWNVTTSDGGRIINATKDAVEVHELTKQGWIVNEQKVDTGSIITA